MEESTTCTEKDVLDVLVLKKGNAFVAQGLQRDITVQGHTLEQLFQRFALALVGHIADQSMESLPRAPKKYWNLVWGKTTTDTLPKYIPSPNGPGSRVRFLEIDMAEAA